MADPALPAVNGVVTSSSTRTLSPHALAGVTGGILVLAVVGAAVRGVWQADPTWDPTLDVPSFSEPATPDPEDFSVTPPPSPTGEIGESLTSPPWLQPTLLTILAVLFLALAYLFIRRLLAKAAARRSYTLTTSGTATSAWSDAEDEVIPDLTDALTQAHEALRDRENPGDAVIAAWVALEDTAAASGAARSASDTPTEFTVTLLHRTNADPGAISSLRTTYLAARFGSREVGEADVATAAQALERITQTWAVR